MPEQATNRHSNSRHSRINSFAKNIPFSFISKNVLGFGIYVPLLWAAFGCKRWAGMGLNMGETAKQHQSFEGIRHSDVKKTRLPG